MTNVETSSAAELEARGSELSVDPAGAAPAAAAVESAIIKLLRKRPGRFRFLQAVRLLELIATGDESRGSAHGGRSPSLLVSGPSAAAQDMIVRFRADRSLAFPHSEVSGLKLINGDADAMESNGVAQSEMTVSFMGLTGPSGVLPQHYSVRVIQESRQKPGAAADFFDLFNNRLIALFYRAAGKYILPLAWERAQLNGSSDEEDFTRVLYSLAGLEGRGLRGRLSFSDSAVIYFSGHFAHRPRSAVGLERMLAEHFAVRVHIKQCQGQWLELPRQQRTAMPSREHPQGLNTGLGVNTIAGERVWDVQSRFRVQVGPLTYREYMRFTPSGDFVKPLRDMVRLYVGLEFDFDLQPVLAANEVPQSRLGGDEASASRLGWNVWACSPGSQRQRDFDEATFAIDDDIE